MSISGPKRLDVKLSGMTAVSIYEWMYCYKAVVKSDCYLVVAPTFWATIFYLSLRVMKKRIETYGDVRPQDSDIFIAPPELSRPLPYSVKHFSMNELDPLCCQ